MAKVLLTYDIDREHVAFKKKLISLGYSDQVKGKHDNNLPNTTMYHKNKKATEARDDAKDVANELGVDLERCFAVEFGAWAAIAGDAHS